MSCITSVIRCKCVCVLFVDTHALYFCFYISERCTKCVMYGLRERKSSTNWLVASRQERRQVLCVCVSLCVCCVCVCGLAYVSSVAYTKKYHLYIDISWHTSH